MVNSQLKEVQMKKIWLIVRIIGLVVLGLYLFNLINHAKVEVENLASLVRKVNDAWAELEKAAPQQAKAYQDSLAVQKILASDYITYGRIFPILGMIWAYIAQSLVWQCAVKPYKAWKKRRIPATA
jgi:hypothetical protein